MVEFDLRPESILLGLGDGPQARAEFGSAEPYLWATWRAYLRPSPEFVPPLLARLRDPKHLPETMLALGATGDPRALRPLLGMLAGRDVTAGFAAKALGHLGDPAAEPALIAALADDGRPWVQVNASESLGLIGTPRALPALVRLADDHAPRGVLLTHLAAARAYHHIRARERRQMEAARRKSVPSEK